MYRYVVVCEMCNNLVKSVFAHSSSSHLPPKLLTDSKQALQELTLFSSSVRERCKNEETSSQFAHATSYSTKLSLLASETNVGQFFDFCYNLHSVFFENFQIMEESPWALGTFF